MASRVDSLQIALPRAVTDAAPQQHAALRQPVVAQEQLAAAQRQDAQQRGTRPQALEGRAGAHVHDSGVPGAGVMPMGEQGARPGRRREPPRRRPAPPAGRETGGVAAAPAPPRPDGKGSRVDVQL